MKLFYTILESLFWLTMYVFIFFLIVYLPIQASARQVNITWKKPTQREDNSALKPEEISHYNLYYGDKSGDYQNNVKLNGAAEEAIISGLPDSDLYIVITTSDTDGRESIYSNELFSEFNPIKPDAPIEIEIEL